MKRRLKLSFCRQPVGRRGGFSLIEALATVAIIGVITFLAIPNIVRMRQDAERNMAVARAEAFNLGVAAYVQALGADPAAADWGPLDAGERYGRVRPYLAFAPAVMADYISSPYSLSIGTYSITGTSNLGKIVLHDNSSGAPVEVPY